MRLTLLSAFALLSFTGLKAATFTSIANGGFNVPATWSVVGADANGIPDSDDDVTITAGRIVTLDASSVAKTLTVAATGILSTNSKVLSLYGNLTNNGTITASANGFQFYASGTISGNAITSAGIWNFYSSCVIAAGMSITNTGLINISVGKTLTNNGTVKVINSSSTALRIFAGAKFVNANGATLRVNGAISDAGILDASAATNTVIYESNVPTSIDCPTATYYNLTLTSNSANNKGLTGALVVKNNLTISSTVTLNCVNNTITIGGNWTNNANTNCNNMSTVTFNGAGTQTITRSTTERFKDLTIAGTGTVQLAQAINVTGNLTMNSGTFDVSASNFAVNIAGNFVHTGGTFNGRAGTVTMNGAVAQGINGFVPTTFYNLTSSNTAGGVTVNHPITVSNILTVNTTAFTANLPGNGSVTIPATGNTTYGRIAPLGATASLAGSGWIIKAFINGPATAYWQYLGTPINGNTLNDWDGDTRFYMSGVGGNDGNACCPIFRSVRTYNTATNTYTNITSVGTALTRGKGYMIWMGDNMTSLTSPLIFDSKGPANFGNVTFAVTAGGAGGGYNLVSNPYACPISFASVQAASGNLGPNFMILQENGSYATNPNGGTIAATQGYMCIATASGNMTTTEACKSLVANPNIIRVADPADFVRIRTTNDVNGLGGETVLQFNNDYHNGFDLGPDMPYLPSPYEDATNVYTTDLDARDLICNALDSRADELAIPVTVIANSFGNQTISFTGINRVSAYSCAWLENTATGEKIDLTKTDSYSFASQAIGERHDFVLHFGRTGNCPLADQNLEQSLESLSQVYVNNGQLMAKFYFSETTDVEVSIYDVEGREVAAPANFSVTGESVALQNPGAHGIYFVRIISGEKMVTKKIYY